MLPPLQPLSPDACRICKKPTRAVIATPAGRDVQGFDCPICGQYFIVRTAYVGLKGTEDPLLPFLSCHTRQVWESDGNPFTVDSNWQPYAELHANTTLGQKLEKLLRIAEKRTPAPGALFQYDDLSEFPLLDCAMPETALFLLNHAADLKLIESGHATKPLWRIKFAGWEHIERTGLSSQAPARVFIAMSFDDAMDPAYLDGIKPAVELDCGFVCVNLKHLLHNDDITDRMLAEIRRCQILVADFTQQKHGVYYEAGFALALGKEVIWCVRKDEMNKVHFDTNHRAHITWEKPADLRTRLAAFIQAKFQDAINRSQGPSR